MAKVYNTPGVYIEEKSAFPNSVVQAPTAIPAFIGYTEKATHNKKEVTNQAVRISSFGEYLQFFGEAPHITYGIENANEEEGFKLLPDVTSFLLFNSIKFFFENGGSNCYIVSIGSYKNNPKKEDFFGKNDKHQPRGINVLEKESEPTMLVIPDALLLLEADCQEVQQEMLKHCGKIMQNRIAILDIYNGFKPRNRTKKDVITNFREGIGSNFLSFGAAYYPWCHTTITSRNTINFTNIKKNNRPVLVEILNNSIDQSLNQKLLSIEKSEVIKKEINKIITPIEGDNLTRVHQTLITIHPLYKSIIEEITKKINLLPPAAAMAGVYSMVDMNVGVFKAPANVSLGSVVAPAVNISANEQEDLNIPLNGKAVNAIRSFPGKGTLVWGARTLDGNSQDWRYINVRRTVIMIEESVKVAMESYVFEPNTANTWANLKAMLTNFLTNQWAQGALAGATPTDAFSVDVGLGMTMTAVDILGGILRVSIKLAVTRPAEFIVLTFEQQMQTS